MRHHSRLRLSRLKWAVCVVQELKQLAAEVRSETIFTVSKTGGHLGSSLGVVELTVALHHVFNCPEDKILWDVGHQAYPHKILTGRRSRMNTLRQTGGLAGFTNRSESEYDPFGAGHSAPSISAGLGEERQKGGRGGGWWGLNSRPLGCAS